MNKIKLTIKELQQLKGGLTQVTNENTTATCKCYYNDTCSLSNINHVDGCSCTCTTPKPV